MELLSVGVQGFSRAALACALALTAIPLTTEWARRVGLVDQPRGRRQHRHAVPLTGGLAIFFGFAASGLTLDIEPHLLYGLFLPAGILLIAGVLDDLFELRPIAKFALQFVAILSAVLLGGLRIESLGNLLGTGPVLLGEWSIPFTIFAVVGVINAINMIDGMDGLAAMIVVAALAWFGVSAYSVGATLEVALIVVLVGAVAGFLAFNFRIPWGREALVFMGDSGSAVLGFLVAWFAIELSQGPHRALYPISAVWILAVPILDTLSVMLRRVARRRSPFQGDRDHVHRRHVHVHTRRRQRHRPNRERLNEYKRRLALSPRYERYAA